MSYTSYEVSKQLWEAGLRPAFNKKTRLINEAEFIQKFKIDQGWMNEHSGAHENYMVPTYSLGQLVREIAGHQDAESTGKILIYSQGFGKNIDWAVGTIINDEDVQGDECQTPEDAAGMLLIKLLTQRING